jgi:hypothetical protein
VLTRAENPVAPPKAEPRRATALTRLVDAAADAIERVPLWLLATALFALLGLANGITEKSADVILRYARTPFSPPPMGGSAYLVTGPFTVVLAHATGATRSVGAFTWFFFALTCGALVFAFGFVRRAAGETMAKLAAVALFCGPLGAVLLTWLGKADPVTFALATVLVFTRSPVVAFSLAVVGGTNHPEHMLVIVLVLWLVDAGDRHRMRNRALSVAALAGVVIGRGIVSLYLAGFGINGRFDRLAFAQRDHSWIGDQLRHGGVLLALSLFAAWWLFPVLVARRAWVHDRRVAKTWALALSIVMALTVATIDQTRVFAVLSWPLVLWALRWSVEHFGEGVVRRLAACCLLLGVLVPFRLDVYEGVELAREHVFFLTAPSSVQHQPPTN